MANKCIDMINLRQIFRMISDNMSIRRISEYLGPHRDTVRKYVELFRESGLSYGDIEKMTDEELYDRFCRKDAKQTEKYEKLVDKLPDLEKELKRVGVTKQLLWQEHKEEFPDGYNYSQFCHYITDYLKKNEAVMHFDYLAGDKMMIDFAGQKLHITNPKTGEIRDVEVFIAILCKSQHAYVEAVESQTIPDFLKATENALRFFGGAPRVIICDNLKSAVNKSCKYEPELNRNFEQFALHYKTTIMPTRSYKPKDKALVESTVNRVYQNIYAPLRNRTFRSIEEVNEALAEKNDAYNSKDFYNRNYSRQQVFEEIEKKELTPLPFERYYIKQYQRLTVNKNYHIYLKDDQHYYSAPYRFVSKKVQVVSTQRTVEIYFDRRRIATHKRDRSLYQYSTTPEHMPPEHKFVDGWSPDFFIDWAHGIGKETEDYIRILLEQKPHPEQSYKSCLGVLSYAKKIGKTRLNQACYRALTFKSYSYITIKNIISKGLDKLEIDTTKQIVLPDHNNVRGSDYYK
jgi:transposase